MAVRLLSTSSYLFSLFAGNVPWILGLFLCVLLAVPFVRWFRVWKALRPLPGPWDTVPFWFLFDNLRARKHRAYKYRTAWIFSTFCSLWKQYPNQIFKVYIGMTPIVFVHTPEAVEALLTSTVNHNKPFLYHFVAPWLGPDNLLLATGEPWRFKRKLLTPAFHFRVLDNYMRIFNENGDLLVRHICSLVDEAPNEPIRLFKITQKCAMDIIGEVTMGAKLQLQENKNLFFMKSFNRAMFLLSVRSGTPWLWIQKIYEISREGKMFRADLGKMRELTYSVMRRRKEKLQSTEIIQKSGSEEEEFNSGGETTLMNRLLQKHIQDSSYTLSDVRNDIDTIIAAGNDTTTTCMCWTLHYLGLYSEVQAKVHRELDEVFGNDRDGEITAIHLAQLKYLECCLKEALRLYPSFPMIGRVLDEELEIEGHVIPKGVMCFIAIYSLHRNPKYFKDPEKFMPERFLSDEIRTRHPFSYIPFSGGSKNCIGQKFAMLEMKLLMAKVLRECRIVSSEPLENLDVAYEVIVKDIGGNKVWVQRRTEIHSPER
ncbi:cytochrome P450 4V2 [Ixodes scapularis]|uniref:cytochrome P450 4V2 n=1 Tax=Ixodes scapularis TaxID=6945 RepID=UPI001A9FB2A2|nr:cytochrome P450 4V2 [Ixodes scapularis]